jgi:hypothetical protein
MWFERMAEPYQPKKPAVARKAVELFNAFVPAPALNTKSCSHSLRSRPRPRDLKRRLNPRPSRLWRLRSVV